jgi:hypothetical protein
MAGATGPNEVPAMIIRPRKKEKMGQGSSSSLDNCLPVSTFPYLLKLPQRNCYILQGVQAYRGNTAILRLPAGED